MKSIQTADTPISPLAHSSSLPSFPPGPEARKKLESLRKEIECHCHQLEEILRKGDISAQSLYINLTSIQSKIDSSFAQMVSILEKVD